MEASDGAAAAAAFSAIMAMIMIWLVVMAAMVVIFIIPIWRILARLGYSPAWSLISLVPFGSLIGLYVLAFSQWPIDRYLPARPSEPGPPPTVS